MGQNVIIYGKSGSGKSTSLRTFAPDEIMYCNTENKLLPFKGGFKYTLKTDNTTTICDQLAKMPCKVAVIDDETYVMSNNFMRNHSTKKDTFEMFNSIADSMWRLFEFIKTKLPEDVIVYHILHEDKNDRGETKILTIGKLLDQKVMLEGMVTICIRCASENGKHFFLTATDGSDITKAPIDMFTEQRIDNDLKLVDSIIREFYGFSSNNNTTTEGKNEETE